MESVELESRLKEYLAAFEARDLEKCMTFYTKNATVKFQNSTYSGPEGIRDWHRERFDADLRLLRVDDVAIGKDTITLEGVATSKRLRAWKLESVNGAMTVRFNGDKFEELSFGVKLSLW
jgi:hypothetical protein